MSVTNYMRQKLCASRTVHIMYSSGTNCMLWSAGECVSASITNYIYHELYTSRTLHIIYQLQTVQSAMVPFVVYITDLYVTNHTCHRLYIYHQFVNHLRAAARGGVLRLWRRGSVGKSIEVAGGAEGSKMRGHVCTGAERHQ